MDFLWHEIFFRPLLNLLIGLYNTIGLNNLGLAIIWLTLLSRITLLPLSLKDERRRQKLIILEKELEELQKHYGNTPTILREEQKALFKRHRFRRWPKIIALAVQGFILLVLYQVFIGGIKLGQLVDSLYSFVSVPSSINTIFLGIDIAQPSFLISSVTAVFLLITIIAEHGGIRTRWTARDLLFAFGLPAATFFILWLLPAVKALFVLVSLLFGATLSFITAFLTEVKEQERLIAIKKQAKAEASKGSVPHPKERFQ